MIYEDSKNGYRSNLGCFCSNVFAISITAWGAGSANFVKEKLLSKEGADRMSILAMTEAVYDLLDSLDMTAFPSQSYKCKALDSAIQVFSLDGCSLIKTNK